MSKDDKRDNDLFNCSQKHEIDYVKNQYSEPEKVKDWIKKECEQGGSINNTSHKELYEMLEEAGFTKK